jgi:hypothetical protein
MTHRLLCQSFYPMNRLVVFSLLAALSACTTTAQSNPARTATEQMLISSAAERAAQQLTLQLPPDSRVFVDNTNFEGTDSKYAIAAIRTDMLLEGMHLVDDKKNADVIIETRAGALSTDRNTFLIGIPSFAVPVPFASSPLTLPEIALWGTDDQKGVAKFAITGVDAKNGTLVAAQEPQYGFAHNIKKTLLIFISWGEDDAQPDGETEAQNTDTMTYKPPHLEIPLSPKAPAQQTP